MLNIYFCLKVALIVIVFCLCFVFRRESGMSTQESERRQDQK